MSINCPHSRFTTDDAPCTLAAGHLEPHRFDPPAVPDSEREQAYVETLRGRAFYLQDPIFDPFEMAHSLGNICRFAGHCSRFYSVAEHSVLVGDIMAQFALGDPFEGLMHDGTESVLADVARPVKALLPDYVLIESRLDRALRAQFGLPEETTDGCKLADWVAVLVEAHQLMVSQAKNWYAPADARRLADTYLKIAPFLGSFTPKQAGEHWLRHYNRWSKRV